jgi:hypothetical protein
MSQPAALTPITDPQQARRLDLSCRTLRVALWSGAVVWADMVALLKLYAHIPLAVALVLGAFGVVSHVAIERYIWRRSQPRLSPFIDPVTRELPGGRLPLPRNARYLLPLSAVGITAAVVYLAAI